MSRVSRRRIAWMLLATCLTCVAMLLVSKRVFVTAILNFSQDAHLLGFADGQVVFGKSLVVMPDGVSWWECFQSDLPSGLSVRRLGDLSIDWMSYESSSSGMATEWCYAIPFLFPIFVLAIPGVVMLWFSRWKLGTCRQCGYNLKGAMSKCPECGTALSFYAAARSSCRRESK